MRPRRSAQWLCSVDAVLPVINLGQTSAYATTDITTLLHLTSAPPAGSSVSPSSATSHRDCPASNRLSATRAQVRSARRHTVT